VAAVGGKVMLLNAVLLMRDKIISRRGAKARMCFPQQCILVQQIHLLLRVALLCMIIQFHAEAQRRFFGKKLKRRYPCDVFQCNEFASC
jgi:hypothetical protein